MRQLAVLFCVSLCTLCLFAAPTARAASLRVAPVGLDLTGGQSAATLTLRNDDTQTLNVQVRVFRWRQEAGLEVLEPTTDVVVSPPISRIDAGGARMIRVVRTAAAPAIEEEAYRVLVDELPPPPGEGPRTVTLLMRHSIPVFFSGETVRSDVAWSIERVEQSLLLKAANRGGRRVRLADVRLLDADGGPVTEQAGLVGYVLPGSSMQWPIGPADTPSPAQLMLMTDVGPVHVTLARP